MLHCSKQCVPLCCPGARDWPPGNAAGLVTDRDLPEETLAPGEMPAADIAAIVDRVVAAYRNDPTCMVQILREVQEGCGWLPPEAIDRMQAVLGVPRSIHRLLHRRSIIPLLPSMRSVMLSENSTR
jgi:hypothetical protein